MSADSTRTKILAAASELFLEGGLAALSVRAIAKRASLSTIGIYSQFEGKQGVLDALYIDGFEMVAKAMEQTGEGLTPKQKVISSCEAYLDVAENFSAHYRLIFGAADDTYSPSPEAQKVAASAFKGLLLLTAETMPEKASQNDIRARAIEVWAALHGYVGLRQHQVSSEADIENWRELALATIEKLLAD